MEPYISPWFFYFAHIAYGIKVFFGSCGAVCFTFTCVYMFIAFDDYISGWKLLNKIKWFLIGSIVMILIAILVPDQATIYQMEIAKHITPDNVNTIVQQIIDGAQQVLEAIK